MQPPHLQLGYWDCAPLGAEAPEPWGLGLPAPGGLAGLAAQQWLLLRARGSEGESGEKSWRHRRQICPCACVCMRERESKGEGVSILSPAVCSLPLPHTTHYMLARLRNLTCLLNNLGGSEAAASWQVTSASPGPGGRQVSVAAGRSLSSGPLILHWCLGVGLGQPHDF